MPCKLRIGKGWGEFNGIFVLDIALFYVLTPAPFQPFVVRLGIQKHEFYIVMYISIKTLFFYEMT